MKQSEVEDPVGGPGYKWTRARHIRFTLARTLFHALMDGLGTDDAKMKAVAWKRIDSDLKACKLTRDDL